MGSCVVGWSFVHVLLINARSEISETAPASFYERDELVWEIITLGIIFVDYAVNDSFSRGDKTGNVQHFLWGVYGALWSHELIMASLIIYPTICWCGVNHRRCFKLRLLPPLSTRMCWKPPLFILFVWRRPLYSAEFWEFGPRDTPTPPFGRFFFSPWMQIF